MNENEFRDALKKFLQKFGLHIIEYDSFFGEEKNSCRDMSDALTDIFNGKKLQMVNVNISTI